MTNSNLIKSIEEMSLKMRLRIIELAYKAGNKGAHLGGSLSSVEILATLYNAILQIDFSNFEKRDRLILSKGHAALAQYCALESIGILTKEETDTFEDNGSHFVSHSKRDIHKGLEFSGGSLGLGMSFAAGIALSCKSKGFQNQIYVLLGDGECNEGIVWEALMFAKHYNLTNLTVIVDHNHLQSDGFIEAVIDTESLKGKFAAFGFNTTEVDGHSASGLLKAFEQRDLSHPNAIIAETIKGKGVSFMENKYNWHHNILSESKYIKAILELNISINH